MPAHASGVEAQQLKLNEIFGPVGMSPLEVDGVSGPLTEQQLCAARVVLNLPVSRADMEPGSDEERMLMSLSSAPIPAVAPADSSRWILIDRTCQVLFAGEGTSRLLFAFPASTGEPGYETRLQDSVRAFRYDPALETGGWHNSTVFPVAVDNPLNGNMYKPIYFDDGQAIHGANNVPPRPQSKGCVRLQVGHQEFIVNWLGLSDVIEPIWSRNRIGVTVRIVGQY